MKNDFFNTAQEDEIVAQIKEAELHTSGEIKVHVERQCQGASIERAAQVFAELNMHRTSLRNGVLIYLAVDDRCFAIIGDEGINKVVPGNFWDAIKNAMQKYFEAGLLLEGICEGIQMTGQALKAHFPYLQKDKNEIPDDVSVK